MLWVKIMDVQLIMFKADGARHDFPMKKSRLVIGRTSSCALRIPLSSVSREHCELYLDAGSVKVKDLGSSNGTFHNNTRIMEAILAAGDTLTVGPVIFTVQIDGKPAEIKQVKSVVDQSHADSGGTITPKLRPLQPDHADEEPGDHAEDTLKDSMAIGAVEFDDLEDSSIDLSAIPMDDEDDEEEQ